MGLIMLPNHEDFNSWLATPPPGWSSSEKRQFAITPDSSIPREISDKELDELYYDAGLFSDNFDLELEEETLCYYPC